MFKRTIDIILSLIGIIVVLPLFPLIVLLLKLDSRGPVFYLADRVGKDMKPFKMYKFRTMLNIADCVGQSLCPEHDPRVTPFGRFLRRTKLNELPQLINVLRGDMTFVGPRPESPDLAKLYPDTSKLTFSVKPGLVGPNQILGRNEEEMYPRGVDVKRYYIDEILPPKVAVDLEYIKTQSIFRDFKYIFLGIKETVIGVLNKKHIEYNRSQIYLLGSDMFLSLFSFGLAYILHLKYLQARPDFSRFTMVLLAMIVIRIPCFLLFGMYNSLIRYISYHDILTVLKGVTCGSLALIMLELIFNLGMASRHVLIIDWVCLIFLLSTLRFGLRFYWEIKHRETTEKKKHRVLIFGAGNTGISAYRALISGRNGFDVIGFIDDAPNKYSKRVDGLKVLGNRYHIDALVKLYKVEEILIAISGAHPDDVSEIIEICQKANLRYRMFSSVKHAGNGDRRAFPIRAVELSDVLSTERIHMDVAEVKEILADKTVLINGSGGALGFELCYQILDLDCKKLIIIDRYNAYLNELVANLLGLFSQDRIIPILIGSDQTHDLEHVFQEYRPDMVFQTGMNKYIPICGPNTDDIVRNNYGHTFNLARLAQNYGCRHFVMISSFSATRGGHLISNSLRISELSLQALFEGNGCRLIISRICDVIENRGGMVSMIESQIRKQRTVTLPSPHAKACLISKYSAAQFILQTLVEANQSNGGKGIYVCEAGSPICFLEVATKLAHLYGLKLGKDLAVRYLNSQEERTSNPDTVPILSSTLHPKVKFFDEDGIFDAPERRTALKKLISSKNYPFCSTKGKELTWQLVNLCGPNLFRGKGLSHEEA